MKRDLDLVRKILQLMEAGEDASFGRIPEVDGFTEDQVGFHVHLMAEAGLVSAADCTTLGDSSPKAIPMCITWAGYEFLEAAKDDTLWAKARDVVLKPAGGAAFGVLLEWLKSEAKARLGLP